jgi:hypothetical protein
LEVGGRALGYRWGCFVLVKLEPALSIGRRGLGLLRAERVDYAKLKRQCAPEHRLANRLDFASKVLPQPVLMKLAGHLDQEGRIAHRKANTSSEPKLEAFAANFFGQVGKHSRNDFLFVHGSILTDCVGAHRLPHLTVVVQKLTLSKEQVASENAGSSLDNECYARRNAHSFDHDSISNCGVV